MAYLWTSSEWTFPQIERVYKVIEQIGIDELGLDPYTPQIEIITSEQMVDAYTSIGLPINYHHWSFGKHFTRQWSSYQRGMSGLAYEIVINSDPCIGYLMEENTMTMQALTLSHAMIGHSHVFKNNHMFREWTDATAIIDYLIFARNYIRDCEVREGFPEVESFLDSCHALMNYGVNRYKRPSKLSVAKEKARQEQRDTYRQSQVNEVFDTIMNDGKTPEAKKKKIPAQPEENILYFCEKLAPDLPVWKREIIRIVRRLSQYFYPQAQTKTLNEGAATYTHYRIMNRLHEKELMTDGAMMEFLHSHTNVVSQPKFDDKRYSGINPYALGFAMMCDIERICHKPTDEDRRWFKDWAGCGDEMTILKEAWAEYRDESMIRQFLSPRVIRDLRLFQIKDDRKEPEYLVTAIHNDAGYRQIIETLANSYERQSMVPQIEVEEMDPAERSLKLIYRPYQKRALANTDKMLKHLQILWGNPKVSIYDESGKCLTG